MSTRDIRRDWLVFDRDGGTGIGAVRRVDPDALLVYIEGYSEITVHADDIASAHDGKVVLHLDRLPDEVREAIRHAHDRESRGAEG